MKGDHKRLAPYPDDTAGEGSSSTSSPNSANSQNPDAATEPAETASPRRPQNFGTPANLAEAVPPKAAAQPPRSYAVGDVLHPSHARYAGELAGSADGPSHKTITVEYDPDGGINVTLHVHLGGVIHKWTEKFATVHPHLGDLLRRIETSTGLIKQ